MTDDIDREIFEELWVKPLAKPADEPIVEQPDDEGSGIGDFLVFLAVLIMASGFGLILLWAIGFVLFSAFGWAALVFPAGLLIAAWAGTR